MWEEWGEGGNRGRQGKELLDNWRELSCCACLDFAFVSHCPVMIRNCKKKTFPLAKTLNSM